MAVRTSPLSSSAITAASYDTDSRQLSITFTHGGTYDFPDVPEDVYDGLINAASPGRYYHSVIKGTYG